MKKILLHLAILFFLSLAVCPGSIAQTISTIAGSDSASFTGDGGPATDATLQYPSSILADNIGNLFIGDKNGHRIRKISPSGIITTLAGTGVAGYSGDGGPATAAQVNAPGNLAADGIGNIYIADMGNQRIRKINAYGIISTVAGTGTAGFSGDGGYATAAQLNKPFGVAIDSSGNIFIAEIGNNRVRKISYGIISTIAGTGAAGYSGDGGPATAGKLNKPCAVLAGKGRNIYVCDSNNCIRRINSSGIISTFAGAAASGYSGDGGAAAAARFNFPGGLAQDLSGNILIADAGNNCIRKINVTGTVSTLAGTSVAGFSGDGGPATAAALNGPFGVAADLAGNTYISDLGNHRIRKINSCTPVLAPINSLDSLCAGSSTTLTDTIPGGTWTSGNTSIATISSGGNVTGLMAGIAVVTYTLSNSCGTSATVHHIKVQKAPGYMGYDRFYECDSDLFNYAPYSDSPGASLTWTRPAIGGIGNAAASGSGGIYEYLDNIDTTISIVVYTYTLSKHGCSSTHDLNITVFPTPWGTTSGKDTICPGDTTLLTNTFANSSCPWICSDTSIATVSAMGNRAVVRGISAGTCIITYAKAVAGCPDTSLFTLTVRPPGICSPSPEIKTNNTGLLVYPSPNNGSFFINLTFATNEDARIIVTNVLGEKVNEFTTRTNKEAGLALPLSSGIYFITAFIKNERLVSKMVIAR